MEMALVCVNAASTGLSAFLLKKYKEGDEVI